MTPYYGGEAKNLGLVQPLIQTTFAELVKEVFGHPIGLSLTRSQFHSLPKRDPAAQRDPFSTLAQFSCSSRCHS